MNNTLTIIHCQLFSKSGLWSSQAYNYCYIYIIYRYLLYPTMVDLIILNCTYYHIHYVQCYIFK